MQKKGFYVTILIGLLLTCTVGWTVSIAQEDEYQLAYPDASGKLRRPQVSFSHAIHADKLAEVGCGVCHHSPDSETGQLVYIEGEELSCSECHETRKQNHIAALREAFHGSCTACHRDLIKAEKRPSGPTTCGGCHKKEDDETKHE